MYSISVFHFFGFRPLSALNWHSFVCSRLSFELHNISPLRSRQDLSILNVANSYYLFTYDLPSGDRLICDTLLTTAARRTHLLKLPPLLIFLLFVPFSIQNLRSPAQGLMFSCNTRDAGLKSRLWKGCG